MNDFMALIAAPKWAIGTRFNYRKVGEAEIVGYHIEHNTDTGVTKVDYRIAYKFAGQEMTAEVGQSTIDRALAWKCEKCGMLVAGGIACPNDGTTQD